jgi:hypothetical protein
MVWTDFAKIRRRSEDKSTKLMPCRWTEKGTKECTLEKKSEHRRQERKVQIYYVTRAFEDEVFCHSRRFESFTRDTLNSLSVLTDGAGWSGRDPTFELTSDVSWSYEDGGVKAEASLKVSLLGSDFFVPVRWFCISIWFLQIYDKKSTTMAKGLHTQALMRLLLVCTTMDYWSEEEEQLATLVQNNRFWLLPSENLDYHLQKTSHSAWRCIWRYRFLAGVWNVQF